MSTANPGHVAPDVGGNPGSGCDGGSRDTSRGTLQHMLRSRVACQGCNHRKVRCDVTRTGIPCSNCLHDAATCQVLPRKKHKPRRTRAVLQPSESAAQQDLELPYTTAGAGPTYRDSPVEGQSINATQNDEIHDSIVVGASSQLSGSVSRLRLSSLKGNVAPVESNRSKAFVAPLDSNLPDDSPLSYIGDRRGARSFVYDLCHPGSPQDARPSLLPKASTIPWRAHEMEYLSHEGAFATLPDDVCEDLIRCYFHHVHFFLPIVDASSFLNDYVSNGRQNISPLLFWSMLLAAANFVEAHTLRRAGFASRKAMKTAMYERAKCLYDLDHGTDKLTLIQSVILMGFWYTDPQDHTGAWYWIGIAITLSQTLGLHRRPQSNNRGQRLSEARQPLVRRIWWTCLVRDRWLSLAKGRPLRISHEDCDIHAPVTEDILKELGSTSIQIREDFIPAHAETLAKMWIRLVNISDTLGSILRIHYRANGPKPVVEDIDTCAEQLLDCTQREILSEDASDILRLHAYQLELFYEATAIVLYRPYVLNGPAALRGETQALWQTVALYRARAAASSTNNILEKIIDLNAIHLLKPMIITAVIPAMQIHLFDCKSDLPLRRGLGSNKLNLCMLVLSMLRETYWSASVIYRLFERAQVILGSSHPDISNRAETANAGSHRLGYHSSSQGSAETGHYRQQNRQQQQERQQQYQHQQQGENEVNDEELSTLPIPDLTHLTSEQVAPLWLNDSSDFSTVDQLLSPGFSISENAFQSVFMGYNNDMVGVYDQNVPLSNEAPIDGLYNV